MTLPDFFVGKLPIFGKLILAPLDGYSDSPFRLLTRKMGSAISYSEFINSLDVIHGHPLLNYRIGFSESERPFGYQLLDDNPERMLRSAELLFAHKPDFFDINFGCPSKSIVHRGAGAALLKDLDKMCLMVELLTKNFDIPITAKIRLGWDLSEKNHLKISEGLETSGLKCLAVHARTRSQGYTGTANWDAIAEIKQSVQIPVIGNGDVRTVADIDRILEQTRCDAVMIGRAAVANPWLFMRLDRSKVSTALIIETIKTHLSLMMDFYGPEKGSMLFRKYAHLILKPFHLSKEIRMDLFTRKDPDLFLKGILEILMQSHGSSADD